MQSLLLLIAVLFVASSEACNARRRPPPPPPRAPPPPQAPPPIVKVVRTQEQNVGFNKCYRKCTGSTQEVDSNGMPVASSSAFGVECQASGTPRSTYGGGLSEDSSDVMYTTPSGADCAMATDCHYECTFRVYTEVALRTITKPTGCGCAFHINIVKPRPARVVGNVQAAIQAQSVTVSEFQLVVWDYKANRVVETIPEFKLERDDKTQFLIANQVKNGNTEDFTSVTAGFSGEVTRFEKLPLSLNLNLPENANHVPALSFTVTQIYNDIKTWEPPTKPDLEKMPNAYQTQCVPYWAATPWCYNSNTQFEGGKRQLNAGCMGEQKVWMKKFLLFPKESQIQQSAGSVFASRLITSFYTTEDCRVVNGVFSIDSEFTQTLSSDQSGGAVLALGTWAWNRVFVDGENGNKFGTRYIHGVPAEFSGIQEVWDKGYSTIKWFSHAGFNAARDDGKGPVIIDAGICQQFNPAGQPATHDKYGEQGKFYSVQAGIVCSPFDDVVKQVANGVQCGNAAAPDRSLMAFINEGAILNFNKNEDSILIMGRMNAGCRVEKFADTLFDVLTFHGVTAGQEPITRAERKRELTSDWLEAGLIYDEVAGGLRHFLHPTSVHMHHPAHHKRDLVEQLVSNMATPPNEESWDMQMATGSIGADSNPANQGDHPLELFPETFSAPVNIDPVANAPESLTAEATTGSSRPPCNRGSIGCDCRTTGARECDLGLECDSFSRCMLKDCKKGQPGCPCKEGNACDGIASECRAGVCAAKLTCTIGTAGCQCARQEGQDVCTDGSGCFDGLCLQTACADNQFGQPGCQCSKLDQSCSAGFNCDSLMGVCLAPRCTSGQPGCRCKGDASCEEGFQCDTENNVCSSFKCEDGKPGCQCLQNGGCSFVGFKCVDYNTVGDRRCVASSDLCATQAERTQKCNEYCGMGNVRSCPSCINGEIYCKEVLDYKKECAKPENVDSFFCQVCVDDPLNPDCQSDAASSLVAASAIVLLAALVNF